MNMLHDLLKKTLNIQPTDKVCILSDKYGTDIADALKSILSAGVEIEMITDDLRCYSLPDKVKDKLLSKKNNVIIICIEKEQDIWHSPERKDAKYKLHKRITSLIAPYTTLTETNPIVDIQLMKELGNSIYDRLKIGSNLRILNESGTEVYAEIGKVFKEDGDYSKPGTGGDFPSGEVGFSPRESSVNGKIAYDLKVQHIGFVTKGDLFVEIKNDTISDIKGDRASQFRELLLNNDIYQYVSEISFGINPCLDFCVDRDKIIEEKMAGTMHFGHGGNSAYGKRVGPHFDCVINLPTVYIDDKLFMKEGKFISNQIPNSIRSKLSMFNLIYDGNE